VRRFCRFRRHDSDESSAGGRHGIEQHVSAPRLRIKPTGVIRTRLTVGKDITACQEEPAAKFGERKPIGSWGRGMEMSEAIVGPEPRGLVWRLAGFGMEMAAVGGRAI
jgi:hypothetical protein